MSVSARDGSCAAAHHSSAASLGGPLAPRAARDCAFPALRAHGWTLSLHHPPRARLVEENVLLHAHDAMVVLLLDPDVEPLVVMLTSIVFCCLSFSCSVK